MSLWSRFGMKCLWKEQHHIVLVDFCKNLFSILKGNYNPMGHFYPNSPTFPFICNEIGFAFLFWQTKSFCSQKSHSLNAFPSTNHSIVGEKGKTTVWAFFTPWYEFVISIFHEISLKGITQRCFSWFLQKCYPIYSRISHFRRKWSISTRIPLLFHSTAAESDAPSSPEKNKKKFIKIGSEIRD